MEETVTIPSPVTVPPQKVSQTESPADKICSHEKTTINYVGSPVCESCLKPLEPDE
jgi:hypothetical protein